MIICNNQCLVKSNYNGCCMDCDEVDCKGRCTLHIGMCENFTKTENDDVQSLVLKEFEQKQLAILQDISNLLIKKEQLEKAEIDLKEQLQKAMEERNITKFESDILDITYVAESKSVSVDTAKIKKLYPDIAAECSKESNRKAYIRIKLKGDEKNTK